VKKEHQLDVIYIEEIGQKYYYRIDVKNYEER